MTHHLPNQAQAELPRRPAQSQVPVLTTTGALVCREAAHNVRGKLRFCRRSAPRCGPQHGRPLWPPLDFSSAKQARLEPGHTHAGKQFHSMRVCHRSASGRPLWPPEPEPEPAPPDSPAQQTGRNRIHVQPPTPRIQHSSFQKLISRRMPNLHHQQPSVSTRTRRCRDGLGKSRVPGLQTRPAIACNPIITAHLPSLSFAMLPTLLLWHAHISQSPSHREHSGKPKLPGLLRRDGHTQSRGDPIHLPSA